MLSLTVAWAGDSNTHSTLDVQGSKEEREELMRLAIETLVQALRDLNRGEGGCRWS